MTKVTYKTGDHWSRPTHSHVYQNHLWQAAVEALLSNSTYRVENITVKYISGEKTRYELNKNQITELDEVAELKKKLDDLREMLLDETGMTPEYIKLRAKKHATRVRRLLSHDEAQAVQDRYESIKRLEHQLEEEKQELETLKYGPSTITSGRLSRGHPSEQFIPNGPEDRRLVERPDPTRVTDGYGVAKSDEL